MNARRIFKPRPYQDAATNFLLQNNRCALFVAMGLGKTSSVLNAIQTLFAQGETDPVLVIAPLRVAQSTWSDEVAKWEHTRSLSIVNITGSANERLKAMKTPSQIKTVNYENLVWLQEQYKNKWPFKTIVFDESTRLKSFRAHYKRNKEGTPYLVCTGGVRATAIAKAVFRHAKRVWLLTGTPCQNSLGNLWPQLFFIDGGKRLGNSYSAFESRWFKTGYDGYSKTLLPNAEEQIQDAISDVVFTLRAEDYLELGEEIETNIKVELPPKAMKVYKDMEKEMFAKLAVNDVETFSVSGMLMKCRQIANGAVYYNDSGEFEEVHDAKLEALQSVIEEANGMPVIVAYTFKSDLERLKKNFKKGVVFDKNPDTLKKFKNGEIPILFLHPASAGHGVDGLQYATNTLCFYSLDWDAELRSQTIARIGKVRQFQAGFNRPALIYNLVAHKTIDEMILERIENKISIEEALKRALARIL